MANESLAERLRRVGSRHYGERPLAKLTDDELGVLILLGGKSDLFNKGIDPVLDDLGDLASRELMERG